MKGKFNEHGFLWIQRGIHYKEQRCMQDVEGYCGDWCSHFSEPRKENVGLESECITIELCHKKYLDFKEFTDEREE